MNIGRSFGAAGQARDHRPGDVQSRFATLAR